MRAVKLRLAMIGMLLVCAASFAQQAASVDPSDVRKQVLKNDDVEVSLAEIPAHTVVKLHRHDRDYLVVYLTDGQLINTAEGGVAPKTSVFRRGDARLVTGGFLHTVENNGATPVRLLDIEFTERQGREIPNPTKPSRYCNAHSRNACVAERYLFCTEKICVSDVEMGPGAVTYQHRHSTDHMVVPLTDLDMRDEITGQDVVLRKQKPGEVIYVPSGISHRLVNGPSASRFIVVSWK
jgi:quercetin dioxygenase-like cupin family protein